MVQGMRAAARASWLTLMLVAALAFALPAAASMAGAAAAAPSVAPHEVVAAAATPAAHAAHVPGPQQRHRSTAARPRHIGWDRASVLVHVPAAGLAAHAEPSAASRVVGTVVGASKYYRVPLVAWAMNVRHGWGRVELPYAWPRRQGWIRLRGLARDQTFIHVDVDLSEHRVGVYKHDRLLFGAPAATGAASSPTPPGHYVVTDRVPFPAGGVLGTFAFGISGIQPHLPAGWSGGNQLAIHGTNDPGAIGTSASAGCVRVSETTLDAMRPLLRLGTPVLIHA
jgi:hypothetical protein